MKWSLRATLTTTLVTLILLTVAALGFNAHRNARFTAEDLSTQILDQSARIVETKVDTLLGVGSRQGLFNEELIRDRQFDALSFHQIARFWIATLNAHPWISRESLALEETGEWSFVRRLPDGKQAIGELRRDEKTGRLGLRDYRPEEYPRQDFNHVDNAEKLDPRKQPWYVDAAKARRQVWSRTYILDDVEGFGHLPGLSCSTPFFTDEGKLRGVLTTSFDVISLSTYLRGFKVGEGGFAFLVETWPDGERRVIAHPDSKILIREVSGDGVDRTSELVPVAELADPKVKAFLRQLPAGVRSADARRPSRVHFDLEGTHYLGAYRGLSTPNGPEWLIGIILPEKDVMARVDRSNQETSLIGLAILAIATVCGLVVSAQVARPLERVVRQTARIGQFEVEAQPVAHSMIREVDDLACVVEETKTSLRSFGKYVPTDLIRQLLATGQEATLGGERRRLTISFCDLANFTTLSEQLSPEELVVQMGDYFGQFSADIAAEGGTVDKYIGDAIMAFWGAPNPSDNHAISACLSALRNQETMVELNRQWRDDGKPELVARVGIMTGEAVIGNIGSPARLNYTAMGDPVNLASRLEGLGKFYGTRILVGDPTYQEARHVVLARPVDWVSVKGKSQGLLIHELLCHKARATPAFEKLASLAEQALALYRDRKWDRALAAFEQVLRLRPADGPARVLADRCRAFLEDPPADDWDGVHHMANK